MTPNSNENAVEADADGTSTTANDAGSDSNSETGVVLNENITPQTEQVSQIPQNSPTGQTPQIPQASQVKQEQQAQKVEQEQQVAMPKFGELTSANSKTPGLALAQSVDSDDMSSTAFEADGKPDSMVRVLAHNDSPVVAVLVQNMGGKSGSWKTKDVKVPAQGLLMVKVGDKIINDGDDLFSLEVKEPVIIELFLQDNGALADAKTRMRVVLYHEDNSNSYAFVK